MSEPSIPAHSGQDKPIVFLTDASRVTILMQLIEANALTPETFKLLRPPCDAHMSDDIVIPLPSGPLAALLRGPATPPPRKQPAARPPRRRRAPPRSKQTTPYQAKRAAMEDLEIRRLRRDGFTPYFGEGRRFLMTPPEFDVVLACEPRQVAQVIHEVLKQSVGYSGEGEHGRREWVALSFRHFERRGHLSHSQAKRALDEAVAKGYLLRRRRGLQRWEYAVHYRQADIVPH
jgi:hypothetical protein